eukprot:scaffold16571_cov122-Isochrysis_galbana.AAC.6
MLCSLKAGLQPTSPAHSCLTPRPPRPTYYYLWGIGVIGPSHTSFPPYPARVVGPSGSKPLSSPDSLDVLRVRKMARLKHVAMELAEEEAEAELRAKAKRRKRQWEEAQLQAKHRPWE